MLKLLGEGVWVDWFLDAGRAAGFECFFLFICYGMRSKSDEWYPGYKQIYLSYSLQTIYISDVNIDDYKLRLFFRSDLYTCAGMCGLYYCVAFLIQDRFD